MRFADYYLGFVRRPRATAATLAEDPRALRLGAQAFLVPLLGYLVVYLGLAEGGAFPSTFAPWLAIPAEHYYEANRYLVIPGMLAAWILAAGVVQILGHAVGARGRFEATLAGLGFAFSIAHWTLLPHDVVVAVLGATGVIDAVAHEHAMNAPTLARTLLWSFAALYLVAFPVVSSAALAGAHGLSLPRGALLGIVGFVVYQLVFVLFNR